MMPAMTQKLTPRAFPCFRESGNRDKITDARGFRVKVV
jgi:hypothetical protein